MDSQNLIIYKFNSLYHILEELGLDLNFKIIFVDNEKTLNDKLKSLDNCLVLSRQKYSEIDHQLILDKNPICLNVFT